MSLMSPLFQYHILIGLSYEFLKRSTLSKNFTKYFAMIAVLTSLYLALLFYPTFLKALF